MILQEQEATAHITLMREFLLLSKSLSTLHRRAQRRDLNTIKTASIKKIGTLLRLKQHFRQWREQYSKVIAQERIAFYAMSNNQGAVLKKCFDALRNNRDKAARSKSVKLKHSTALQRRSLQGLRRITSMLRVCKAMQYHRDRATKVCFLQFW